MNRIKDKDAGEMIYNLNLADGIAYIGSLIFNDLDRFNMLNKAIIANYYDDCLDDVREMVCLCKGYLQKRLLLIPII